MPVPLRLHAVPVHCNVWLALVHAPKERTKSSHGRLFAIHVVLEDLAVQSGRYECAYLALRQWPRHLPGWIRFLASARDEKEKTANGGNCGTFGTTLS